MKILMIGAHPDDCDYYGSGLAAKYVRAGHTVKFLSICNGCGGHHEMDPNAIAGRRFYEIQEAAKVIGITYDVWDIPDCTAENDLRTRERIICYIRAFCPDLIITHRTNDYHADHRAAGLLVQDASYLLIVPNYCPQSPAMRRMPVIAFFGDNFQNPPFRPDIVIETDEEAELKFQMADKHVSQVYEWLPYTHEDLETVPTDPKARFEWLKGAPVTEDMTDEEILALDGNYAKRFAIPAALYRKELIARYGEEKGKKVRFAESYEISEYGAPLTPELAKKLFPF